MLVVIVYWLCAHPSGLRCFCAARVRSTGCSELGAQLTQLRDELAECRTTLSAAIDTVQGQSSAARDKLSDRIDEIKAKVGETSASLLFSVFITGLSQVSNS